MSTHAVIALIIFGLVYAVIIAGENSPRKLDRPAAALIGAVLMVLTGVLSRSQALAAINFETLALLFGMMMIVHYATISGLLDAVSERLMQTATTPKHLIWVVCFASGLLSALFVNDTICLLMTPLLLTINKRMNVAAEPVLICLATSSNIGSALTITGNPQNMLIGISSGWGWAPFALRMLPIVLICLFLNGLIVLYVYRKSLKIAGTEQAEQLASTARPFDRKLANKTIFVTIGLLIAFLAGYPMDLSAITAGVLLMVLANEPPEQTFANIDWALLLFFAGLFVVIGGITLTETAAIQSSIGILTDKTQHLGGLIAFSAATLVASNVFGNVPLVMLARNFIHDAPHAPLIWMVLATVSTFAGNLTLVGSVANLIVANGARRECNLSFMTFLKVGVPTTIVSTAVGVALLWCMHVWHLV